MVAAIIVIVLLVSLLGFACAAVITRNKNKEKLKIKSSDGIQEECYVELGGVSQYLQIRGENKKNPVMLFLHGGPGGPMAYVSFFYQTELERQYTMVQWDQRGCGRSYFKGPKDDVPTTEQLLSDLDQLVDYLKDKFSCEKVFLMGYSWGSLLGCLYIKKHPEKVSGYIGVSQCVNVWKSTLESAKLAIEQGVKSDKLVKKLQNIYEKVKDAKSFTDIQLRDYVAMKMCTQQLKPYPAELAGSRIFWLGITSPYFTKPDWEWYKISVNVNKLMEIEKNLMKDALFDLDLNAIDKKYEVPMCFISGASDTVAPVSVVQDYVNSIEAPSKKIYVLDNAGHTLFLEQTEQFNKAVKEWTKECN